MLLKQTQKLILILILTILASMSIFSKKITPIFYEIKTDSSSVYLIGTVHLGKKEWYPLPKAIEENFQKADYLVTEIDINKIDPSTLINQMLNTDSTTLKDKLKAENYNKVKEKFAELQIPEEALLKMRPWFVVVMFENINSLEQSKIDAQNGVDMYFTNKANELNKEIKEIETAKEQINYLTEFDNFADEMIEAESQVDKSGKTDNEKLILAWEKGDENALDKIINQVYLDYPKLKPLMDNLLLKRNLKMAEKIDSYLKDKKTYFIAVGAGHLVGKNGIISILNNKKIYKIRRIK
jgi:uncharacterized protein YbaP (TraB family)